MYPWARSEAADEWGTSHKRHAGRCAIIQASIFFLIFKFIVTHRASPVGWKVVHVVDGLLQTRTRILLT